MTHRQPTRSKRFRPGTCRKVLHLDLAIAQERYFHLHNILSLAYAEKGYFYFMGKIIETDDGTPVFVGEPGEREKDIA